MYPYLEPHRYSVCKRRNAHELLLQPCYSLSGDRPMSWQIPSRKGSVLKVRAS